MTSHARESRRLIVSTKLTFLLLAFYAILMVSNLLEHNYPKALYWLSAGLIVTSVYLMK